MWLWPYSSSEFRGFLMLDTKSFLSSRTPDLRYDDAPPSSFSPPLGYALVHVTLSYVTVVLFPVGIRGFVTLAVTNLCPHKLSITDSPIWNFMCWPSRLDIPLI